MQAIIGLLALSVIVGYGVLEAYSYLRARWILPRKMRELPEFIGGHDMSSEEGLSKVEKAFRWLNTSRYSLNRVPSEEEEPVLIWMEAQGLIQKDVERFSLTSNGSWGYKNRSNEGLSALRDSIARRKREVKLMRELTEEDASLMELQEFERKLILSQEEAQQEYYDVVMQRR